MKYEAKIMWAGGYVCIEIDVSEADPLPSKLMSFFVDEEPITPEEKEMLDRLIGRAQRIIYLNTPTSQKIMGQGDSNE